MPDDQFHKLDRPADLPFRYQVMGVGRVGSYAKAKRGGYSRSRKYWVIVRNYNGNFPIVGKPHIRCGWEAAEEFGTFKTKKEAIAFGRDNLPAEMLDKFYFD